MMSVTEPVRRLEVFTGAGQRRRWSAEQKARIVAESFGPVESVCNVARRHGLAPTQLFAWRKDALSGDNSSTASTSCPARSRSSTRCSMQRDAFARLYNHHRPHGALDGLTPARYLAQLQAAATPPSHMC